MVNQNFFSVVNEFTISRQILSAELYLLPSVLDLSSFRNTNFAVGQNCSANIWKYVLHEIFP